MYGFINGIEGTSCLHALTNLAYYKPLPIVNKFSSQLGQLYPSLKGIPSGVKRIVVEEKYVSPYQEALASLFLEMLPCSILYVMLILSALGLIIVDTYPGFLPSSPKRKHHPAYYACE